MTVTRTERQSFVDRWLDMPAEHKAATVGGPEKVAELDALARRLLKGDVGEEERAEIVRQAYVVLDAQLARIEGTRAHLERMILDRNAILSRLVLAGESQGSLARRTGVTPMAVSFSVGASVPNRAKKA